MSRAVVVVIAGVAGTLLSDAVVAAPLADLVVVRTYNYQPRTRHALRFLRANPTYLNGMVLTRSVITLRDGCRGTTMSWTGPAPAWTPVECHARRLQEFAASLLEPARQTGID